MQGSKKEIKLAEAEGGTADCGNGRGEGAEKKQSKVLNLNHLRAPILMRQKVSTRDRVKGGEYQSDGTEKEREGVSGGRGMIKQKRH